MININGFYKIKQQYFDDFKDFGYDSFHKYDRPFYYAIKRDHEKFYWFIPLTTQVDRIKRIIKERELQHKPNDIYYICDILGIENAFKIGDITPISDFYIEREYTKFNKQLFLQNKKHIDEIEKKAKLILNLIDKDITYMSQQIKHKSIIEKL